MTATEIMAKMAAMRAKIYDAVGVPQAIHNSDGTVTIAGVPMPQSVLDTFSEIELRKLLDLPHTIKEKTTPWPKIGGTANFEAAIYSRLDVFGNTKRFDHLSVYKGQGDKFFVFVVHNNIWNVFEDDALFPSDKLISALRCLNL